MGKKISELNQTIKHTGEELIPLSVDGDNKSVKVKYVKGADNQTGEYVDLVADDGNSYRVTVKNGQLVAIPLEVFSKTPAVDGDNTLFDGLIINKMYGGVYIQITNRNLEFEYTVTNGDVDIDVIKGKRKRERIASIRPKDIEMVAPIEMLGDASYTAEIDASAHDDRYDVYFILADVKGAKTKILVNPSKKMLDILKKYKGEKVIIGEE